MIVLVFLLIATASALLPESNAFQTPNNKRKILQGTSSSVQLKVSFSSEWYAVSAFPVAVPPPPVAVFEQQQQTKKKNRRRNKVQLLPGHQPLQTEITTSEEMDTFLNNSNDDDDRLVIIKFYASWCKSCAKVGMKMDRLALEHADHVDDVREKNNDVNIISRKGNVRIANVEFATNRELCQRMGITRLPTIQMYITSDDGNNYEQGRRRRRMMKKVQDFPCPPSKFHQVEDLANFYMNQQQSVQNEQQILFESTLDLGHDLIGNALEQEQAKAFQTVAAPAPFSSSSLSTAVEEQQQQHQSSSFQQQPRRRFWSRLRRRNNNSNKP